MDIYLEVVTLPERDPHDKSEECKTDHHNKRLILGRGWPRNARTLHDILEGILKIGILQVVRELRLIAATTSVERQTC